MDVYRSLFDITRLLVSADDRDSAAELLLRRIAEVAGADRGFIVVREGDGFVEKFDIRSGDDEEVPSRERTFSRSLVESAVKTRQILHARHPRVDPRFATKASVQAMRICSVLVAPLHYADAVYGAIYLEHPSEKGFREEFISFLDELCGTAALFLKRAIEREALERQRPAIHDLFTRHDFTGIVTHHPKMLEVLEMAVQVADSNASILIRGETGTGKELLARAVHANSPRKKRPLVTVHCTALPQTVLESELFGHVRGAFTGADHDRTGRLASADGGTLFLDEIAEIPVEVQAKLLRFLQFGEIQRLGSDRVEKLDVRIVAATHQDLTAMIQAGTFRKDLYFRIRVVELTLPPLRERGSDMVMLLEHFLRAYWRKPTPVPRLSPMAERALLGYSFPGNVRELASIMERACLLARSSEIDLDLLPPEVAGAPALPPATFTSLTSEELEAAREAAVGAVEREFLTRLMDKTDGNISLAARVSGIHRSYLQRLLTRYSIRGGPTSR